MEFNTNDFHYDVTTQRLTVYASDLRLDRLPKSFKIRSSHTGKVVEFVGDEQAALEAEFWDGELMEYIPVGSDVKIKKVVIFND